MFIYIVMPGLQLPCGSCLSKNKMHTVKVHKNVLPQVIFYGLVCQKIQDPRNQDNSPLEEWSCTFSTCKRHMHSGGNEIISIITDSGQLRTTRVT